MGRWIGKRDVYTENWKNSLFAVMFRIIYNSDIKR